MTLLGLDRRERRRFLAQIEEFGATHALLAVVNKCLLEHLDALEQRRMQEDLLLVAIATNVLQSENTQGKHPALSLSFHTDVHCE